MRMLVADGMLDEVERDEYIRSYDPLDHFSGTRIWILLPSHVRQGDVFIVTYTFSPGFPHPFSVSSPLLRLSDSEYLARMDGMLHACSRLPEYFQSHPLESPSSSTDNPYSWTHGMEGQDWIKVIGHSPEKLRKFAIGISVGAPLTLYPTP